MNCTEAQNAWHAQCDGELAPEQAAALALHCTACPECRARVQSMNAITDALAELRAVSNTVGTSGSARRTSWLRRGSRVAAAVALLLGAGVISHHAARDLSRPVGGTPTSVPQPSPPAGGAKFPVQVALSGESEAEFIPVARTAGAPNVHVFVLFERP